MNSDQETLPPGVILGDTHYRIPGDSELHPYSEEAIKNDTRFTELWGAMIKKLETEPADSTAD